MVTVLAVTMGLGMGVAVRRRAGGGGGRRHGRRRLGRRAVEGSATPLRFGHADDKDPFVLVTPHFLTPSFWSPPTLPPGPNLPPVGHPNPGRVKILEARAT